jgi:hypothetical protein
MRRPECESPSFRFPSVGGIITRRANARDEVLGPLPCSRRTLRPGDVSRMAANPPRGAPKARGGGRPRCTWRATRRRPSGRRRRGRCERMSASREWRAPLLVASSAHGHESMMRMLVSLRAEVDAPAEDGWGRVAWPRTTVTSRWSSVGIARSRPERVGQGLRQTWRRESV